MKQDSQNQELARELALAWLRGQDTSMLSASEFTLRFLKACAEIQSTLDRRNAGPDTD